MYFENRKKSMKENISSGVAYYELLSIDEYYNIIYGTTDSKKLSSGKMGLTINVINRLEEDGQLENISIDVNNNLYANTKFEAYKQGVDDFYRFELNKFL